SPLRPIAPNAICLGGFKSGYEMPSMAAELSAIEIKRLKHPGRGRNVTVAVGGVPGLLMQLTPTGGKTWLLRCRVGDRRREIGLGGYPEVTLAMARDRARE